MAGVTYLVRALPFMLLRRPIQSRFVRSALHYAPFAVLGAMTFPDILFSAGSLPASAVGMLVALVAAWRNTPMVLVALLGCIAAIVTQLLLGA